MEEPGLAGNSQTRTPSTTSLTLGTGFGVIAAGSAPLITELGVGAALGFGGLAIAPALPFIALGLGLVGAAALIQCP
jgi:hypothetical protein